MSELIPAKVTKVLISFSDPSGAGELQYMAECLSGDGFKNIEIPFDPSIFTPENFQMRILADNGRDSGPIDYDFLSYQYKLAKPDPNDPVDEQVARKMEEEKKRNAVLNSLPEDFFRFDRYAGKKFAKLSYSDVTERDMFGYEPIKAIELSSSTCGMWAWSCLRKLEFKVEGLSVEHDASDFSQRGCLYWKMIETKQLPEIAFEDGVIYNDSNDTYTVYCNTNELGRLIEENSESSRPGFKGRFELHFSNNFKKEAWGFPVGICVHDTTQGKLENDSIVSIDFGTSSTCAAYQPRGGNELLRLSGDLKNREKGEKPYENPTNLMIYDWDVFQAQWNNANPDMPILRSPSLAADGELDIRYADYDSGYTVEKIFGEVDDEKGHRKMEAILTRLKSIPFYIENGNEIKFVPYNDRHRLDISITDELDAEDASHFNPIRFYGYLLGRIINNPKRNCYYTKYYVSYPVKFDDNMREIIRQSLADGIMRSLPRPVRENLDPDEAVKMLYAESVACLGALIPGQLRLREGGQPQVFAIFDLGGGTLDTSFGMFREANDDELEEAEYTIQVLGIGGDPHAGGENLIHRLVFKIYQDNKDQLESLRIPFQLPLGEDMPADMDPTLIRRGGDKITEANLRVMVEQLGRPLFKHRGVVDGKMTEIFSDRFAESIDKVKLTLRDTDNTEHDVILTVEGIDDFLMEAIEKIIGNFKKEMEQTFEQKREFLEEAGIEDFSLDELAIFLGGNTSRQQYVEEVMRKEFPDSLISLIGNTPEAGERNPSERTTVKTAVAFGQLKIGQFYLDDRALGGGSTPFRFYILYKDMGTGEKKVVLQPCEADREWHMANLVDRDGKVNLYYTTDPSFDEAKLKPINDLLNLEDPKKRTLFLRVFESAPNTVEYRIGSRKDTFSAEEPANDVMTFRLKEIQ